MPKGLLESRLAWYTRLWRGKVSLCSPLGTPPLRVYAGGEEITDGDEYLKQIDIAPGVPGNPLSQQEHERRFWDCIDYASKPVPRNTAEQIVSLVQDIENFEDVRVLIPLFLP